MAHIVKFDDGKYAVRRYTFLRTEYLDSEGAADNWYWWGVSYTSEAKVETLEDAKQLLNDYKNRARLPDFGNRVEKRWYQFWK